MDRIAAMTVFVRVVEAGNFTKAADTLDLPNATVTRLIQGLEQELQVRLLHRTTRAVTVTPEGAAYYERVVRLLADLADIESSTRMTQGKPTGKVRVDAPPAIVTNVIVPALAEFYRDFPEVEIELGVSNRRSDLVAEGIDCVIRAGELTDQLIVARRIGTAHSSLCATPALLAAHGTPASPDELAQWPTIGLMSSRTGRSLPFRLLRDDAEQELTLTHKLVVNDTNSYVSAALAGLGIIQVPTYAARDALRDGRLVRVLPEWHSPAVALHVLYAPNRYLSAKVRVFIDWIVALFERSECLRRS